MKKLLLIFNFSVLILNSSFAQPTIQWQKSLGGTGNDAAYYIQQTADGGYIIAGNSNSDDGDVTGHHGSLSARDFWIVKTDSIGTIQWQKSLGGTNDDGYARSIKQTIDGGYILVGYSQSSDGDLTFSHGLLDGWIVKLNSSGIIQWQKSMGGTNEDFFESVNQTNDGGYIIAGTTKSNDGDVTGNHDSLGVHYDYWVVKLDSIGGIQWQKCLGGTYDEYSHSIELTTDGGYIVCGTSGSSDGDLTFHYGSASTEDYWIVKLDGAGNIQWQKVYGGTYHDIANSVRQTFDGGYIVAGCSGSLDGDVVGHYPGIAHDYWILKLNSSGNLDWQKCLIGNRVDEAYSIIQTADSGYVVAGFSTSDYGDMNVHYGAQYHADAWIAKLFSNGTLEWQKIFGGTFDDQVFCINSTSDGGFIYAGWSHSNDIDVSGHHGPTDISMDYWIAKLLICTPFSISTSFSPPLCYGGIATASIDSIGGAPPYTYQWSNGDTTQITQMYAGTYTVTVEDYYSCTVTATITITQPPQLTDTTSSVATDIACIGTSSIVVNGGTPPYQYQWSNSATTATINNLCTGWYYVTVTDANDCQITDSVFVNFIDGMNDIAGSQYIFISPNPFTTQATISFNKEVCNATFSLYNLLGEKVAEVSGINGESFLFNRDNLRSGVYVFEVREGKSIWRGKAVVY